MPKLTQDEVRLIEGVEKGLQKKKSHKRIEIAVALLLFLVLVYGGYLTFSHFEKNPEQVDLQLLLLYTAAIGFGFLTGNILRELLESICDTIYFNQRRKVESLLVRLHNESKEEHNQSELDNA